MINEVLATIHHVLPERLFILLPSKSDPELALYSDHCKAVVRIDDHLPVFVVVSRDDGKLISWGEGISVMDAVRRAVAVLESKHTVLQKAA